MSSLLVAQEQTNVRTIKERFDEFKDERVKVVGFITQYIEDVTKTTDFYFLKDDYGGIIKVRTSRSLPRVGRQYEVVGVVDIDVDTQDIFITEESRMLVPGSDDSGDDGKKTWLERNWPYVVGGLGILFVLLLVIVIAYAQKQKRELTTEIPLTPIPGGEPPVDEGTEAEPEPAEVLEGSTVKLKVPPPGTLKILPGRFVVLEGDDKIKEIRFYKTKGAPETEVTFGRAEGPNYSHIQLKPMSVSAKHAKLIYAGKSFTFINYSKTNPTRVNEQELAENGSVELKNGDKIEMGEMVFEFKLS